MKNLNLVFLPDSFPQSNGVGTEDGCHSSDQDWEFSHLPQSLPISLEFLCDGVWTSEERVWDPQNLYAKIIRYVVIWMQKTTFTLYIAHY